MEISKRSASNCLDCLYDSAIRGWFSPGPVIRRGKVIPRRMMTRQDPHISGVPGLMDSGERGRLINGKWPRCV